MADSIKRLDYFDHQFLRAKDFLDEQTYFLEMRRRHNMALHTWGVARGLEVTIPQGGAAATVAPGVALDSLGREIVLLASAPAPALPTPFTQPVYLTVAYSEAPSDMTTETGTSGATRVTETAVLALATTAPADPGTTILLAIIDMGPFGTPEVSTLPGRVTAGPSGDIVTRSLSISSGSTVQTDWARLSLAGPKMLTLDSGLGVIGGVNISGPVNITNELKVSDRIGVRDKIHLSTGADPTSSLSINAYRDSAAGAFVFPNPSKPAMTVEMECDPRTNSRFEVYFSTQASTESFLRRFSVNGATGSILSCENGGTFGIGAASGDVKLDVNGRTRLRQGADSTAGLWFNQNNSDCGFIGLLDSNRLGMGKIPGQWALYIDLSKLIVYANGGVVQASDARLKKDVTTLENALDSVSQLRGVEYTKIDRPAEGRKIGFIAQEVQAVLPDLVATDSADGMLAVDYSRVTAVLVEAVKALREELRGLKERVAQLEPVTA